MGSLAPSVHFAKDLGETYLDRVDEGRTAKNLVRRLERLGYQVSVSKAA